jgi:hypothetical protein
MGVAPALRLALTERPGRLWFGWQPPALTFALTLRPEFVVFVFMFVLPFVALIRTRNGCAELSNTRLVTYVLVLSNRVRARYGYVVSPKSTKMCP